MNQWPKMLSEMHQEVKRNLGTLEGYDQMFDAVRVRHIHLNSIKPVLFTKLNLDP